MQSSYVLIAFAWLGLFGASGKVIGNCQWP